jgi:putative addiction module component (TIGR02574 family)
MNLQEIRKQALELTPQERQALVEDLLLSLDEPSPAELHALWEKEISRRVEELRSGKVKGIPWEEVQEEMRRRLESNLSPTRST